DYFSEIKQELALRKQLLSQTIQCAKQEALDAQSSLSSATGNAGTNDLVSTLSGKLNDAVNFYDLELQKLDTAGISGSISIAKEVLVYRMSSYDVLAGNVNNYLLWAKNQNLFATAQTRFDQTSRAVAFLESAAPNGDLQNAMNSARASFANAADLNNQAKRALMQGFPPDQSLQLIQLSLSALADTYQRFFDVSTIIKSILP
ncbi:MAG: hypothetical protein ACREIW_03860, partial [Chthoniobacterales bacterium]